MPATRSGNGCPSSRLAQTTDCPSASSTSHPSSDSRSSAVGAQVDDLRGIDHTDQQALARLEGRLGEGDDLPGGQRVDLQAEQPAPWTGARASAQP